MLKGKFLPIALQIIPGFQYNGIMITLLMGMGIGDLDRMTII
jgi:hypothetical protein